MVLATTISGYVYWLTNKARVLETYHQLDADEAKRELLLHIRQDVQLIAFTTTFFLATILIMLGIIADRIG
jgi:hypothetical protein